MSTQLVIKQLTEIPEASLHLMPCGISHVGEAKVKQYFEPSIKHIEASDGCQAETLMKASFRGRPLEGMTKKVPTGYTGLVLGKGIVKDAMECVLEPSGKFHQFAYWNLDQTPSANDKFEQAMKWIDISAAIHSSVSDTNSQASSAPSQ